MCMLNWLGLRMNAVGVLTATRVSLTRVVVICASPPVLSNMRHVEVVLG